MKCCHQGAEVLMANFEETRALFLMQKLPAHDFR